MNILDELKEKKYTILASNDYYSFDNGIEPVISKLNENINFFKDLAVADKIIGKASAMLLVLSGVKQVYCLVLSKAGKDVLDKYNIEYYYETLTDYIVNRLGNGICPMEETVKDIDDLQKAYTALRKKVEELKNEK